MPELPEVETVVRELRPHLTGARIASITSGRQQLRRPWRVEWEARLVGTTILAVRRRGKWIVLELEGRRRLVIHLGMTGQLTAVACDLALSDHTHLIFGLSEGPKKDALVGKHLRFRDVRRFGSATLFEDPASLEQFFVEAGLGPEPWDLQARTWRKKLTATSRCLKAILLDQRVVAGVGNIYADESLFQAKLHPARRGNSLEAEETTRLRKAIIAVLERAIEQRGSSIRDYVGGSGLRGSYQDEFRAYGRTGKPCSRCKTLIAHLRLAGRSTHYCPRCQPDPD